MLKIGETSRASGLPGLPGGWSVVGNTLCNDTFAVRIQGRFETEAERQQVLGELCRRLNGAPRALGRRDRAS